MMGRVRNRDTQPELKVRSLLHRMGYRFRLHVDSLPGTPDIVLTRHRKIVQVFGCFWHQHPGCLASKRPNSRVSFWNEKLDRNVERDRTQLRQLSALGWEVLVVWECQVSDAEGLVTRLADFLTA